MPRSMRGTAASRVFNRLAQAMEDAIPDCLVSGYEQLIEGLKLPALMTATCWRLRSLGTRMRS